MQPLKFPNNIPPNFQGKWRFQFVGEFNVDGLEKNDCLRLHADIVEI